MDYAASRADSRMDDVREQPSRRRRAKVDPNFYKAMEGYIKPRSKEKQDRVKRQMEIKRAWEELEDARHR